MSSVFFSFDNWGPSLTLATMCNNSSVTSLGPWISAAHLCKGIETLRLELLNALPPISAWREMCTCRFGPGCRRCEAPKQSVVNSGLLRRFVVIRACSQIVIAGRANNTPQENSGSIVSVNGGSGHVCDCCGQLARFDGSDRFRVCHVPASSVQAYYRELAAWCPSMTSTRRLWKTCCWPPARFCSRYSVQKRMAMCVGHISAVSVCRVTARSVYSAFCPFAVFPAPNWCGPKARCRYFFLCLREAGSAILVRLSCYVMGVTPLVGLGSPMTVLRCQRAAMGDVTC